MGDPAKKYLTVKLQAHELPWRPITVQLELDGERLAPDFTHLFSGYMWNPDIVRVGFSLDAARTASEGRIVFLSESREDVLASWTLTATHLEALNAPPILRLTSFEVPSEATDTIPVSITVENTWATAGTFYGVLSSPNRSHGSNFELPVEPTTDATHDTHYSTTKDDGTVELTLSYGYNSITRTVDIDA